MSSSKIELSRTSLGINFIIASWGLYWLNNPKAQFECNSSLLWEIWINFRESRRSILEFWLFQLLAMWSEANYIYMPIFSSILSGEFLLSFPLFKIPYHTLNSPMVKSILNLRIIVLIYLFMFIFLKSQLHMYLYRCIVI